MSRSKIQLGHNLPILTLHLPTVKVSKFHKQIFVFLFEPKKQTKLFFEKKYCRVLVSGNTQKNSYRDLKPVLT